MVWEPYCSVSPKGGTITIFGSLILCGAQKGVLLLCGSPRGAVCIELWKGMESAGKVRSKEVFVQQILQYTVIQ